MSCRLARAWTGQFPTCKLSTVRGALQYRRTQIAELRPYEPGRRPRRSERFAGRQKAGSPKAGDMIARNPKNHTDQWLVDAKFFAENFEPLKAQTKVA